MAKPAIPDIKTLMQAGINPKTGLPIRLGMGDPSQLKQDVKKFLRIIDEQDAVNRYKWYNLPANLSSQELERMLYFKGQLCFFYFKELEEFYFMPYALDGTIDFYGRFNTVHPVPYTNGTTEEDKKRYNTQLNKLSTLKLKVQKSIILPDDLDMDTFENSCVLLWDYTKQLSETIIPRQVVNDGLLGAMAECVPFMRSALLLSTGVKGVRVNDADQAAAVWEANRSVEEGALTGNPWVAITAAIEMQELANGATNKAEEYMLAMQSLDNLRLSGYGIDNGGLFEKKAHELQVEANVNGGPVGLVLQDGLDIRQNFCNIVNSIWGLGIWCEPAESAIGVDLDGDGVSYDRNESGENSGVDSVETGGESNE